MKRNLKKVTIVTKVLTAIVISSMTLGSVSTAYAATASTLAIEQVNTNYRTDNVQEGSNFTVMLNGADVTDSFSNTVKVTTDGRTLIPLRDLGNILGADVGWDSQKVAILTKDSTTIEVPIGSTVLFINGQKENIDAEGTQAVIVDSYTYLPLRAISEALGATVEYEASTKTIYLTTSGTTGEVTPAPSAETSDPALAALGLYTATDLGYDANNGPNPGEDYYDSWNTTVTAYKNAGLTDEQINNNLQYVYLCKDTSDQMAINDQVLTISSNTTKVDKPSWDGEYKYQQYYYWQWTGMRWITAYDEYSGTVGYDVSMS
ncbi:MAG: copper amine oxidase N-terminal domain-containing protein [Clostridiales bacterium]|nr:copper amine oxidase N-terminal domain-containing protein [Clostridiales bacterium]